MKRSYQLIKLKANAVQDLKRLKTDMGTGRLNELVNIMIRVTDEPRQFLGGTGWCNRTIKLWLLSSNLILKLLDGFVEAFRGWLPKSR